ncbi:histidine phosphatase superfamily [Dipodascopsis uninucleata]
MGAPLIYEGIDDQYRSDLELKQVQILFRHGERTAVHRSIQEWNKWGFPIFWPLCESSRSTRTGIINPQDGGYLTTIAYEREIETTTNENPSPLFNNKGRQGICLEGQLTDRGRVSGYRLGQEIRKLYIDKLAFLPRIYSNQNDLYMRTTSIVRSRETLQQLFAGLYPITGLSVTPRIYERFPFEENLYPTMHNCPRLKELRDQFLGVMSKHWTPKLEGPSNVLKDILSSEDATIKVGSGGKADNAWAIIDTYVSAAAHNIKTPSGFEDRQTVNSVARAALESEFIGYERNMEMKRLGMGNFLQEVLQRMIVGDRVTSDADEAIAKLAGKKQPMVFYKVPKLALYAAHDSSIGAILSTLGVFDRRWIQFTSHIVFEHFGVVKPSRKGLSFGAGSQQENEYVRIKYNGRPVEIPACAAPGDHLDGEPSFCTMSAFKKFVKLVAPGDRSMECLQNLGQQAKEIPDLAKEQNVQL